jgi:hypothetical protein
MPIYVIIVRDLGYSTVKGSQSMDVDHDVEVGESSLGKSKTMPKKENRTT